jgi:hypothetical protein
MHDTSSLLLCVYVFFFFWGVGPTPTRQLFLLRAVVLLPHTYLEVWVVFDRLQVVEGRAVVELVKDHNLRTAKQRQGCRVWKHRKASAFLLGQPPKSATETTGQFKKRSYQTQLVC